MKRRVITNQNHGTIDVDGIKDKDNVMCVMRFQHNAAVYLPVHWDQNQWGFISVGHSGEMVTCGDDKVWATTKKALVKDHLEGSPGQATAYMFSDPLEMAEFIVEAIKHGGFV